MDADARARIAEELWVARCSRQPIEPISARGPDFDVQDAYDVQSRTIARLRQGGANQIGHKVGLTSRAMQEMLGVSEPDFGVLLDQMVVPPGGVAPLNELIQPRIEAEIAVKLRSALAGPDVTVSDAIDAIGGVAPALEIIDSRIVDWRIGLVDTVADNASSAMVVLGAEFIDVDGRDLRLVGGILERNGILVESGAGAAVLGHPAACVAWLANKLATFGDQLDVDDVVLPGAVHKAVDVMAGDVFVAEFDGLGSVSVHFSTTGDES